MLKKKTITAVNMETNLVHFHLKVFSSKNAKHNPIYHFPASEWHAMHFIFISTALEKIQIVFKADNKHQNNKLMLCNEINFSCKADLLL